MGRILAIDYGLKRSGLAITDPLKMIASPLETVPTHKLLEYVRDYASKNDIETVVVGMPLQMSGEPSDITPHIRGFIGRLRKELPLIGIETADERFTSKLAMKAMVEGGVKKSQRRDKGLIDRLSASIMLRDYLEAIKITK